MKAITGKINKTKCYPYILQYIVFCRHLFCFLLFVVCFFLLYSEDLSLLLLVVVVFFLVFTDSNPDNRNPVSLFGYGHRTLWFVLVAFLYCFKVTDCPQYPQGYN